jgi:hypothetical protein
MAGEISDEEAAWRELVARLAAPAVIEGTAPWPTREELPAPPGEPPPDPARRTTGLPGADAQASPPQPPSADPIPGVIPAPPQARLIRPATPAPLPSDDESHYIPPPPPPLPHLDPLSKGAWLALFGGPLYLLLAVILSWTIPGWAAFCAVGAFVGGFATLVIKLGDGPPRDSGPDDGAVV